MQTPVNVEQREPIGVEVDAEVLVEELGDDPERAERGDEGEGERDAGEVGGDARERRQCGADGAGSPGPDGGVRHQEAEQAAEHRGDQADLDAGLKGVDVLRRMDDLRDVLRREGALLVLEGADQDDRRREQQERD